MDDNAIVMAMLNYGGSFVKQLSKCYWVADDDNRARIKATWPEYWAEYAELAALKAGQ